MKPFYLADNQLENNQFVPKAGIEQQDWDLWRVEKYYLYHLINRELQLVI